MKENDEAKRASEERFEDRHRRHLNSLLHPLGLVVGTEGNPPKQDRPVKVHSDMVPERTEWVPILKTTRRT